MRLDYSVEKTKGNINIQKLVKFRNEKWLRIIQTTKFNGIGLITRSKIVLNRAVT